MFSGGRFHDEAPIKTHGRHQVSKEHPCETAARMVSLHSPDSGPKLSRETLLAGDFQGFLWTLSWEPSLSADLTASQWDKSCHMLGSVAPQSK